MGDRGNIYFVDASEKADLRGIYMYTHWSGSYVWKVVKDALKRGNDRWGDSQYLGRIIFCELVKESLLDTTGFGLSTSIGDNEHTIVRVDDTKMRVSFHAPGKERAAKDKGTASWSYDDYVKLPDAKIAKAFGSEDGEDDEVEEAPTPKKSASKKPKKAASKKKKK